MRRIAVCSQPGCPELAPCPHHSRPRNQPWTRDRNRAAQQHFRDAVLHRDEYRCTRCGKTRREASLVAHHVRPGYDTAAGVTLCDDCHRAVDSNAR